VDELIRSINYALNGTMIEPFFELFDIKGIIFAVLGVNP
jgi:hypothetical protein